MKQIQVLKSAATLINKPNRLYARFRPAKTYGSNHNRSEGIRIFERNCGIEETLRGENIFESVKPQRLHWFGHVQKMSEGRVPKKVVLHLVGYTHNIKIQT
ncbi:hypothetical protein WA026_018158 [Henosepilachna vigintioctopunctata]|uniref:Uncharacterized protein n=1 Tax=Henosepilachna vigintioctopunctata TaxID=420089 RepID=A0AAW1UE71_9CUCU